MYFEDGFKYNQEETTELTIWGLLNHIKSCCKKSKTPVVRVSGIDLVKDLFKKFNIEDFHFINDDTLLKLEVALRTAMKFLIENDIITSDINCQDKVKKNLLKEELYGNHEFSNRFEIDPVMEVIFKMEISFGYIINPNFLDFYTTYSAFCSIVNSNKKVLITLPDEEARMVLAVKKEIEVPFLTSLINQYDFSGMADYIACYVKADDEVLLFNTQKNYVKCQEERDLVSKILDAINTRPALKKEFVF